MHFLKYLAGVATLCPLNSRRMKHSRASERSDQAIEDDFHQSKFLIPVANASTGDVYVTTPCISYYLYVGKPWLYSITHNIGYYIQNNVPHNF